MPTETMPSLDETGRPAPGSPPEEYRTDDALPPAVRELVIRGRVVIRQAAEAASAAEREKQAANRARAEAWLRPVRQAVERAVPAEIHLWVQYPVEELTKLAAEFGDNLPRVAKARDLIVRLRAPGCDEIAMPIRHDAEGWYLVKGYEFQTGGASYSDLAAALAHARDAFLRDLDVPL